jgi:hypothetical protein
MVEAPPGGALRRRTAMRAATGRMLAAGALTLLTVTLMAPAAAHGAFGVESFFANTVKADDSDYNQAGGRPDRGITSARLNTLGPGGPPDGSVKYLRLDGPPGLITDPEAVPKCDEANASACPVTSRIGDVVLIAYFDPDGPGPAPIGQYPVGPLPLYNMVPPAGRPSEFAFSLAALGGNPRVEILGGVRDTTDYGLYFELLDIPPIPPIVGTTLTFYGNPGAKVLGATDTAFVTEPTSCGAPAVTKLTLESSTGEVATAEAVAPSGTVGCDLVPFAPGLDITPSTTKRDSAAGGDIVLTVPQTRDPNVLASSHVKDTAITLPEGFTLNPSAANGLEACTDAQFGKGTEDPVACPAASILGTAQIISPPIGEPLTGLVYLGAPVSGDKYRLFLRAASDLTGVDVRLIGSIRPDPATGRVTTVFPDTPEVPFSSLSISLDPAKQTLATPLACGPAATTSVVTPYRGAPDATPGSSTTIDADGAGAACDGTPFAPGFTATSSSPLAGADTAFVADVTRADGHQFLSQLSVRQPDGLVGRIPAVPLCAEAQAAAGTCGSDTRIGTATVDAGAGSPFRLTAPVYLTGAYKGAPYGLSIVIRALAGPFDLGTVVVRSAIRIDKRTAALTVESDPLPQILEGIPLRLRRVNVNVDRQGFLLNGTSCSPRSAAGTFGSTAGATATGSATVTLSGCERLAFTPKLAAVTGGRPTFATGASLFVTLTQPPGQINLSQVNVQLPSAFLARGTTLTKACLRDVFNTDPAQCGEAAKVGTASSVTTTLPFALTGDAFLVARDTERKLPTVEIRLETNLVRQDVSSDITVGKRLTSNFPNLPDVPQTQFKMDLPQGKDTALAFRGDPCSGKRSLPTVFTGQDGRTLAQTVPLKVENCRVVIRSARVRADGRSAVLKIKVPEAGTVTVSGRYLQRTRRTLKRPADSATVIVRLTSEGVAQLSGARAATAVAAALRTTATARLVPRANAAATVELTPSRDTARLTFPSRRAPAPAFTG